ncbi:MAG TPA: arginine decarboxylase, partial [Saprospiraceae bacterium]|nr:arginine decarboxylase [Saprospiraceae bacterium]
LMNTLPDIWGIKDQFILLPINKWNNKALEVRIGGLSCDRVDCYSGEFHNNVLALPEFSTKEEEPLYIGFFHTAAYQDALAGFGGINHCLIATPKHIVIKKDKNGDFISREVFPRQKANEVLGILGFEI